MKQLLLLACALMTSPAWAQESSCCAVGTNHGMGSGTVIGVVDKVHYILTNHHVCDAKDKYIWVLHNKKRYRATFVAHHPTHDLAVVAAHLPEEVKAVALASADPSPKEELRHFGHATGPQEGSVMGYTTFDTPRDGKVLDGNIFTVAGDSGSGFFNKKGELVSVHYLRVRPDDPDSYSASVRVERVRELLKRIPALNR